MLASLRTRIHAFLRPAPLARMLGNHVLDTIGRMDDLEAYIGSVDGDLCGRRFRIFVCLDHGVDQMNETLKPHLSLMEGR